MKSIMQFKSFKTRLLFWFLTVALLPLLVVSTVIYFQRTFYIKDEAFKKLVAIRDLKVKQVETWLDEKMVNLSTFSNTHRLKNLEKTFNKKKLTEEDKENLRLTRSLLINFKEAYKDYAEIFIINPISGKIDISTNTPSEGLDKSKDPYFTQPLQTRETYIKDIYYSSELNQPSMTFSRPIFCLAHNGEHIVGILVTRINLEQSLYKSLRDRTGMGNSGEILIINQDRLVLNDLRWDEKALLNLKIKAKASLLALEGNTGIIEAKDYRGERVLAAYTNIPRTKWGFVSKQDLKEVYRPIQELLWNILIIFLISGACIYLTAMYLARTVSQPILGMVEVSRKIRQGDWSARHIAKASDELGYLAQTLNHTADSMASQLTIQQGVSENIEAMVQASSLEDFLKGMLQKLLEVTDSHMGASYLYDPQRNVFEPFHSLGVSYERLKPFDGSIFEGEFGKALFTKKICHIKDIPEDTIFIFKTFTGNILPREIVTIPIVVEDRVTAIISLAKLDTYSKEDLEILNQVWLVFPTAYANLIAVEEIKRLNQELDLKNQELQAQADELKFQSEELQQQAEELQEKNIELELQGKQVEEADRLKSEFLSNMSHELRTPLSSILALSRVLIMQARGKLSAEEGKYLEIIERNGKSLLNLINDILDLSKIEAGRMEISPSLFSLHSTIEVIIERLMPMAEAKGLKIIKNIPRPLPLIESDEARVHQILENVISNAVKFTEQGTITVSIRYEEEKILVEAADTGIGIAEKDLSYIFEEFRQVDGSFTRKHEGTGLGLAIAQKTARLLGGEISATSELGKGSVFTLTLPRRCPKVVPSPKRLVRQPRVEKKEEELPGYPEEPKPGGANRILLVEDSEPIIIQIKKTLEMEGYDVDVARTGQEAIDYVQHTIPDGMILDLMMPEMDGFEVLEKIRGQKATTRIPVLILTAKDLTAEDLQRLRANNIQQLVQKGDVDRQELLSCLSLMLKKQPAPPAVSVRSEKEAERPGVSKKETVRSRVREIPAILIVEDNPDHLIALRTLLKPKYTLLEAANGEQGIHKTLSDQPDLVLLDMALPDMDGIAVLRKIKENPETCSIPVIAVTAQAMKGDREKFIEAGCEDYIAKPYVPEELLHKIKQWLEK